MCQNQVNNSQCLKRSISVYFGSKSMEIGPKKYTSQKEVPSSTPAFCQALVPSPVPLDPNPKQSQKAETASSNENCLHLYINILFLNVVRMCPFYCDRNRARTLIFRYNLVRAGRRERGSTSHLTIADITALTHHCTVDNGGWGHETFPLSSDIHAENMNPVMYNIIYITLFKLIRKPFASTCPMVTLISLVTTLVWSQ